MPVHEILGTGGFINYSGYTVLVPNPNLTPYFRFPYGGVRTGTGVGEYPPILDVLDDRYKVDPSGWNS